MKQFLTERGAAMIMVFALTVCDGQPLTGLATAQTLVGLPEYGATLSGTSVDPIIENHSNQTVIGPVLRVFDANSAIPVNAANFKARGIWMHRPGNEAAEGPIKPRLPLPGSWRILPSGCGSMTMT